MLNLPVAFFNEAKIIQIGTEKVIILELIINGRVIEKSRIFLSKGAMKLLHEYLIEGVKLDTNYGENKQNNSGEDKVTS